MVRFLRWAYHLRSFCATTIHPMAWGTWICKASQLHPFVADDSTPPTPAGAKVTPSALDPSLQKVESVYRITAGKVSMNNNMENQDSALDSGNGDSDNGLANGKKRKISVGGQKPLRKRKTMTACLFCRRSHMYERLGVFRAVAHLSTGRATM